MLDLIIENGTLIDGTGTPRRRADVGVSNGRVDAVGDLRDAQAARRIEASGRVVCPGFIDLHTHCGFDPKHSRANATINYLQQGVTTVVGGNCGFGPTDLAAILAVPDAVADGPNLAMMIGHNSIRLAVMDQADRVPSPAELDAMKRLVRAAMECGAIGFSSGLYYVPGCYATTDEVAELAKTAAAYGGFYSTHMRTEGDGIDTALKEAIQVGRASGLPVQVSHHKVSGLANWGRSVETLALIEAARAEGIDVSPDQYPYTASCARIGIILPRWVCAGSDAEARARLQDASTRSRAGAEAGALLKNVYGGELERIAIATSVIRPELAGKTFADIAVERDAADPYADMAEFVMDLAGERPASCDTMCIFHSMCEADVERIMAYEHTAIASDGWSVEFGAGHPHPRLYGTFPRVLAHYCRERLLFPLEEAVRKMTSLPAARLGIHDRGILTPGTHADITVFDPETVADRATFADPHQYPVGIDFVIVNGEIVLDHGTHTGALPGVFIPR